MKKIISIILCAAVLLSMLITVASADGNDGIAPCLNNTSFSTTNFIIEDETAYVSISYDGYPGITTGATITSKIQKKFLLFFWKDVDIGMPNNEWVDEVTGCYYLNEHTAPITSKGTYRAVVDYVIRGTGGSDDVFTAEIEFKYE